MLLLGCLLAGCTRPAPAPRASTGEADAAFARLADEYIAGYLAWRPQTGTSLGLHEYDGEVTDYSQASLAAELARLKSFDQRLGQLKARQLSRRRFTITAFCAAPISGRSSGSSRCEVIQTTR